MHFRLTFITRDTDLNGEVLRVHDHGVSLTLRNRNPEELGYVAGDGVCEIITERAVSERIVNESRASGTLSVKKDEVRKVHFELSEFARRVLRIKRWCQGRFGHHEPIRLAHRFQWSLDGDAWK